MDIIDTYFKDLNPEIKFYYKILCKNFPEFLIPYIETSVMQRLKDIGYFCGMDYGSLNVYQFKYYISRLDHSVSTALIVWNFTQDKVQTLAALFHDAGTPAFSHTIDYMNKDYLNEESTEAHLHEILSNDQTLLSLLNKDNISLEEITDFKRYPLVDVKRPKLCADRIDGIFLTSLAWTKKTNLEEIETIYNDIFLTKDESDNLEYGFTNYDSMDRLVTLNEYINKFTHSNEDYMSLTYLALITKELIKNNIIKYQDLFLLTDASLMEVIKTNLTSYPRLNYFYQKFINMTKISFIENMPALKERSLNPLYAPNGNGIRYTHL